jgi:hypothetical protein
MEEKDPIFKDSVPMPNHVLVASSRNPMLLGQKIMELTGETNSRELATSDSPVDLGLYMVLACVLHAVEHYDKALMYVPMYLFSARQNAAKIAGMIADPIVLSRYNLIPLTRFTIYTGTRQIKMGKILLTTDFIHEFEKFRELWLINSRDIKVASWQLLDKSTLYSMLGLVKDKARSELDPGFYVVSGLVSGSRNVSLIGTIKWVFTHLPKLLFHPSSTNMEILLIFWVGVVFGTMISLIWLLFWAITGSLG